MTDPHLAVLLVEDNPQHAKLIKRQLEGTSQHFELHHVETLAAAREHLKDRPPRVLLLDLKLPDSTDPVHTVQSMLSIAEGIPIVVLTSMSDLEFAVTAVNDGAQDYLVKGDLSGELLVRAINYAIHRARLLADLRRSNQELLHFAYVVAHELRSPLSQMLLTTSRLHRDHKDALPDGVLQWIEDNQAATRRIADLVSELLAFAKVAPESDIEPIRLPTIVAEVRANLMAEIEDANAEIDCREGPTILANPTILGHVLSNLVSNAIKYRGAEAPKVHISARETDEGWEFLVADNGLGIKSEDFDRIFSLFARAHIDGLRPGVGIGLAFCKQAIEKLGGRMWVESEVGRGSRFYFTLAKPSTD
ncbi:MAG TPA: ATP-binding protein [Phycisphaerae bacterium]|nr:ATP-binding protein [Phycisphaerae bacterium]HRW51655.1 ATP-binding protein [Phycisphaerae bacterium]